MNYSELLDNVRSYTEVDSNVLSNSIINVFITNVENKVDRAIDSDSQRRYATTTCTANNAFLDVSGPEGGFRFARGLQLIDANNNISWIEQRDTTFIDEYSVTRSEAGSSTNGQPKYWANWDATNLILAPTPDQVYTIEMWYNETPERISNTNTTTFLSNNAPEVLLYGTIAEAYSFLKNPQDMQLYEAKFTSALKLFADEQMGRKRRDEYTDGVLRIPLTSMDPGGN
jgi:hypothetical protein